MSSVIVNASSFILVGPLRGLAESLDKPYPWAVGFFLGNTELSMEL